MRPWLLRSGLVPLTAWALACGGEALPPGPPPDPARRVEWPVFGGDPGGLKYSPLEDITPANVGRLRQIWSWRTGEGDLLHPAVGRASYPGKFEATPVMLGDTLYLSTPLNQAVALDADTGAELWRFDPGAALSGAIGDDPSGFVHRGVAVWTDGASGERRVFLNSRWRLIALDARSGRPVTGFGTDGTVDLTRALRWEVNRYHYGNTSPPVLYRDLVIVGSAVPDRQIYDRDPPGDVQAFDARTGRPVWRWEPVPRAGAAGSESWEPGATERTGHANVWAAFTVDTARGLLYLPVSAASNDWYGGRRKGADRFSESLVCLDAATGRLVWHQQLQHHGLWDYDPPSQPTLLRLDVEGRSVEAVALAGKTGFVYLFERLTGRPLFPLEERPVSGSDVPGEEAFPTQPAPTRPPPFARQGIADTDLVDFTPALRAMARARVAGLRLGPLFTPPSLEGTVVLPGWIGGAGWGGGAFDSVSGTLYVKATNRPALARLIRPDPRGPAKNAGFILDTIGMPDEPLDLTLPTRTGLLRSWSRDVKIPIVRPPYGTLTALDLGRGVIKWQVTLGDTPEIREHPVLRALRLPPLGVAGAPGPIVTRSGLLFLTGGGRVLYAIDAGTGAIRGSWDLGGRIGYSIPMTYRTAAGRQYVVLATGNSDNARLVAFALGEQDR